MSRVIPIELDVAAASARAGQTTREEQRRADLVKKLDARRFNFRTQPIKPVPLFTMCDQSIATPGNLVAIQSQAKQGKTAFLGGMFAGWMCPGTDFLGAKCCDDPKGALIHFDSEQSPYDHWEVIERARRRAGVEEPPEHLRSYCLTDLPMRERRAAISLEMERAKIEAGCIFGVFIDGLGDLATKVNDEEEAIDLVAEMHRLAIDHATVIFCVLHENEGSENSKMRGHLGSQLARKAETNLRLQKGEDGVTVVFSERSRHCHITKANGPRFKWDNAAGMHIPAASEPGKADAERDYLRGLAENCLADDGGVGLTWSQLAEAVERTDKTSGRTAIRRIEKMLAVGAIRKVRDRYRLS